MINEQYKQLIDQLSIKFSEELGNNFLIDDEYLEKEYDLLSLREGEVVLEIGAGIGLMIDKVKRTNKIIAIEKDIKLFDYLSNKYEEDKNVVLLFGDFLDIPVPSFDVFFSNLPFHIADAILYKISKFDFSRAVLSMPFSFFNKLIKPTNKLFLFISQFYDIGERFEIPSTAFYPVPKTKIICVQLFKKKNAVKMAGLSIDVSPLGDLADKQIKTLTYEQLKKVIEFLSSIQ